MKINPVSVQFFRPAVTSRFVYYKFTMIVYWYEYNIGLNTIDMDLHRLKLMDRKKCICRIRIVHQIFMNINYSQIIQ
jgi:hypothetical protein